MAFATGMTGRFDDVCVVPAYRASPGVSLRSRVPSLCEGGDCLGSEGFWDGLSGDAMRVVGGTVFKHSRGFADNGESEDLGTVEEFSAG